jgi:hypothetical protein
MCIATGAKEADDKQSSHLHWPLYLFHTQTESNGTVQFNNGSLEIAVFQTAELDGGYFFYNTNNVTNKDYTMNHVTNLLNKVSVNITLTNITVITWKDYSYCNKRENITFQLVLASDSDKTFALLLYNGTDNDPNCNPPVVTGFKAEGIPGYNNSQSFQHLPLLRLGNAKSVLRTGNAGMKGVFIYRIDGIPQPINAIDLLIPYTGDYFDMILRRRRNGYNVKHTIAPFKGEPMRLFIYDDGAVSFGNRLGRGSFSIRATGKLSFENVEVHFFVNPSDRQLSIRRDQILNLLKSNETEGVDRFNPKDMVVVTWTNVLHETCNKPIRFQIALVSGDLSGNEKTYALLIDNVGEGCDDGEIQYTIDDGNDITITLEGNAFHVHAFP